LRGLCYMDRNGYGEEKDFGAPTQGFLLLGLPAAGPSTGPIVTMPIYRHTIEHWARNGGDLEYLRGNLFKDSMI